MITRIGIVAGEILNLLEDFDRSFHVDEIEFYIGESYEIILMSLGWLSRQGLVHLKEDDSDEFIVSLIHNTENIQPPVNRSRQRFDVSS